MKKHLTIFALIVMMGITGTGYTQVVYKINDNKNVAMKLSGTSSLHNWEMDASRAKGEAQFSFDASNGRELSSMDMLTFTLEVTDLKSDSKGLDKNAYKALDTDKHKYIRYKLTSATESTENGGHLLKTKGKLTVAGVTKDIAMDIHLKVNENNSVTCKGSYELKMTHYNVEPPSFMFGAMSTGDDTKLSFEVTYVKQNEG